MVTNGDFDTAIPLGTAGAGWTFIDSARDGSSGEYYNGGVRVIRTTNQSRFRPIVGNTTSNDFLPLNTNEYVITYEILSSSGQSTFTINLGGANHSVTSLVGTHTYYLKSGGSNSILQFSPKSNSEFVIDNVSIKQIINADLDFTRATSGSVVGTANRENANGVLEEVVQNVPRINYLGGEGHWLIEPEARNTATYSNDFTQGTLFNGGGEAGVDNGILTSAQATSPDGTNNAWKLADNNDGNSGAMSLRYYGTNVNSESYNIISLFVKKQGNNDWFQLSVGNFNPAFANAYFNISNGTLGTVSSNLTSADIEDYGDGWYRISAAFTPTTNVQGAIQFRLASADQNVNITRNGTNGAFIYGVQTESTNNQYSTKPTSYIPTSNGQVTRAEDKFGLNTTLDTSLIDSTEGTFYAEMAALDNNLVDRNISLSDGDDSNTIRFRYTTDSNGIQISVKVGTAQAVFKTTSFDITDFLKIGLRFKENDFACFVNGNELTDTAVGGGSIYTANTLTKIKGTRGDSSFRFRGKIKCIAVFKEGLTDSELTCLTS